MDASGCPDCGARVVADARFCGRCGAAVEQGMAAEHAAGEPRTPTAPDVPGAGDVDPSHDTVRARRPAVLVGVLGALLLLLVVLRPSSAPPETSGVDRTGVDTGAALADQLEIRWDVPLPGIGGPTGAGRPPAQLPAGAVATADAVVDGTGVPVAVRPPGAVADGVWAVAGADGLVLGDATTGRVTEVRPWPSALDPVPVGAALAWIDTPGSTGPGDVVLAVADGGAVRLGPDLALRWRATAVPVVGDRDVTSGGGPLVPAREPDASSPRVLLDLRDGQVVARVSEDLRLFAAGHGVVVTGDDDVVAAWAVSEGSAPVVLPGAATPLWELPLAPGRPVAVDVVGRGRLAVHAMDTVVGEVRLVEARDGTEVGLVAGWPNADLDGGRTAEAFDDVVAGVVGDELRGFAWDGTRVWAEPLGREGWFVTGGSDLLQLVARRTGEVLLVGPDGRRVPTSAPAPTAAGADRLVAVTGSVVALGGSNPAEVRWVDALTGELDVPTPRDRVAGPEGADRPLAPGVTRVVAVGEAVVARGDAGAARPGLQLLDPDGGVVAGLDGVLGAAGPVDGDVLVLEPAAVARLDGRDGSVRWRTALPAVPALATLAPGAHPGLVVTTRHAVVPLADGTTVAVAHDDGSVAWTVRAGVPSAVVGADDDVLLATVDGRVLRLAPDGSSVTLADVGAAAAELAVVDDGVVVVLLPERLVGIGPPGGPIPDDDRVELSAPPRGPRPSAPAAAARWHPASVPLSMSPGG